MFPTKKADALSSRACCENYLGRRRVDGEVASPGLADQVAFPSRRGRSDGDQYSGTACRCRVERTGPHFATS